MVSKGTVGAVLELGATGLVGMVLVGKGLAGVGLLGKGLIGFVGSFGTDLGTTGFTATGTVGLEIGLVGIGTGVVTVKVVLSR